MSETVQSTHALTGAIDHDASAPILRVENLSVEFASRGGRVRAVDGVTFDLHAGETLGIVGESGCGKSVTALSVLRLVPTPPGRIVSGRITLEGRDLLALPEAELEDIRGSRIAMVFQEPMTSLNPVLTIGRQICETIIRHEQVSHAAARRRAADLLDLVRMSEPQQRLRQYPHELSGGMRQRVVIAMALSCSPKVLIADEPTTALDVTIQAQILDLLADLKRQFAMSVALITHDLGIVAETCQRVIVMYAGKKVEEASTADLFRNPRHPYTCALMRAMPRLARHRAADDRPRRLSEIPGMVPSLANMPKGCRFAERCSHVIARCRSEEPSLRVLDDGHVTACWDVERREGLPAHA